MTGACTRFNPLCKQIYSSSFNQQKHHEMGYFFILFTLPVKNLEKDKKLNSIYEAGYQSQVWTNIEIDCLVTSFVVCV